MSRTNWTFPRRKSRQAEASERQSFYDGLSTKERIAVCDTRPGNCTKERARLFWHLLDKCATVH